MNSALIIFFVSFAALIFLFFCHVNLVIIYEKGFLIYYRFFFIKIRIYPFKELKKQDALNGFLEAKDTVERLRKYRELSQSIFGFYYRALRLKILNLEINVSSSMPSSTALYYSYVSQAVSYLFKYFERNLVLKIPKKSNINIRADFFGESSFKAHFVIYTYLGPLVIVSFLSLLKRLISHFRRLLNGTFKAKRVN